MAIIKVSITLLLAKMRLPLVVVLIALKKYFFFYNCGSYISEFILNRVIV